MIPAVSGNAITDWVWPVVGSGYLVVPDAGEQVWVTHENGDKDFPVWIGMTKINDEYALKQQIAQLTSQVNYLESVDPIPGPAGPTGSSGLTGATGPQGTPTTVNGKTGTSITLTAADVGAAPSSGIAPSAITGTAVITTDSRLSNQRIPTDNSVTSAKIADGAIVNADINASAAIAQSKIANLTTDLAGKVGSTTVSSIVVLTQAAYDALTPVSTTLYVIVG